MLLSCGAGVSTTVSPKGNQSWIFIGRTDAEAEAPTLWTLDAKNWLIGKDPAAGKHWRQEAKGMTEDEMVGWHHWLNGHEFQQASGVGDGQGGLECCCPWGHRVGKDWSTELNRTELIDFIYTLQLFWIMFFSFLFQDLIHKKTLLHLAIKSP